MVLIMCILCFYWFGIPDKAVNSATALMHCQSAVTNNTADTVALMPTAT